MTVYDKYTLYFETYLQYNRLNKSDKKVLNSYVQQLRQDWTEALVILKLEHKEVSEKMKKLSTATQALIQYAKRNDTIR